MGVSMSDAWKPDGVEWRMYKSKLANRWVNLMRRFYRWLNT